MVRTQKMVAAVTALVLVMLVSGARAANWPQFRGTGWNGVAGASCPQVWGTQQNVRWKISLRNIRREANDWYRSLEKEKAISEDELHKGLDDIQKLTAEFIEKVDGILE